MIKQETIESLKNNKVFIALTEDIINYEGSTLELAALIAAVMYQNKVFRESVKLGIDAYNDYKISMS